MNTFAAIDFETANGNIGSVCSVGIVVVRNGEITDRIYSLIRPRPNFYLYWNTRIHGLTCHHTDSAPDFPEVWAALAPRIEGLPLVAHNSPFDEGCLKSAFANYGLVYPNYRFHCTVRLSRKRFPNLDNHKLPTVAAHCGYDLNNHHHALADAEACAHIMLKCNS